MFVPEVISFSPGMDGLPFLARGVIEIGRFVIRQCDALLLYKNGTDFRHTSISLDCCFFWFVSICPSTIFSLESCSPSSLTERECITALIRLLIKSCRGRPQGHLQWRGLCVYTCAWECKIRPGQAGFQSFTGYQRWLRCCGAFRLTGLFIAFHYVLRAESMAGVEERSQIKICCQTQFMYRRQLSKNLHCMKENVQFKT